MMFFDKTERDRILADYYVQVEMLRGWEDEHLDDDNPSEAILDKYTGIAKKITELTKTYVERTPVIPISRCPFSGEVAYLSVDQYGIDGPWWNYTKPLRATGNLPVTFHTITGSLKLGSPFTKTDHQVRPGPEKPYLIKQLIQAEGVKAVISSIKIGPDSGFVVIYYTEEVDTPVEPANLWGQHLWEKIDRFGNRVFLEVDESDFSYIFNLNDWIQEGKLLWIQPDDNEFTLRTGVINCPYLGVDGDERFQIIIDGELTYPEEEE